MESLKTSVKLIYYPKPITQLYQLIIQSWYRGSKNNNSIISFPECLQSICVRYINIICYLFGSNNTSKTRYITMIKLLQKFSEDSEFGKDSQTCETVLQLMLEYIKHKCYINGLLLTPDERVLMVNVFKEYCGTIRSSIRSLYSPSRGELEKKRNNKYYSKPNDFWYNLFDDNEEKEINEMLELIKVFRTNIIIDYVNNVKVYISHVENMIIPLFNNETNNSKELNKELVYYNKILGDNYRYLCEYNSEYKNNESEYFIDESQKYYKNAILLSNDTLKACDPLRLGLILNHSVFVAEILNDYENAIKIGKKGFDECIKILDQLDDQTYKDSTCIMPLLRDNLTLWQTDPKEFEED